MATWWLSTLGSDANDGTSYAQAKATLGGVFALAGLATGDTINVVADGDHVWPLVASEYDVKAGTKGTDFALNFGLLIRGTDELGNPKLTTVKAASAAANGARSWFRVIANTGFVIARNFKFDASEKTADASAYWACRMRDTGTPDPGPVKFEGCSMIGAALGGAFPSVARGFFDIDSTAPPSGSEACTVYGCYAQNTSQLLSALGTLKKTIEHVMYYVDVGSGGLSAAYSQTLAGAAPNAQLRFVNNSIVIVVGTLQLPPVLGVTTSNGIDIGTLDSHSNLLYLQSTAVSPLARFMTDSVAGTKAGVTFVGTIGHNVILCGPDVSVGDVYSDGFYEGVADPDRDDTTGSDLHAGDVLEFGVFQDDVFAHPTESFAWDPLGNGVQLIVPKDLRPLATYHTAALDGGVVGALPAYIPPVSDWARVLPESPVSETWSWLTSVVTAYDGSSEQRMALRMQPRRRWEMSFLLESEAERRAEYRRLFTAPHGRVRVPFLPYATPLTQNVSAGVLKLFFDPARTDVRDLEFVVVHRPSTGESFLVEISTVLSDGATLTLPLAQDLFVTDYLVPSMEGFLERNDIGMRPITGELGVTALIGDVRSSFTRPGSSAVITAFDGLNVLDQRPLAEEQVLEVFNRHPVVFDNDTGLYEHSVHWLHPFVDGSRKFLVQRMLAPTEMDYWRDFLHAVRGQREPFLAPTFREDLALNVAPGAGSSTIDVVSEDYDLAYFPYDSYKRLRLEAPDGEVIYRKVASVLVLSPTVQRLTLTVALPGGSNWAGLFTVGYLNRVRLASDVVQLMHLPMVTLLELSLRTTDT